MTLETSYVWITPLDIHPTCTPPPRACICCHGVALLTQLFLTRQQVTRAPGPVPGIGTKITAVTDPDGFKTVLVDEVDIEKELEEEKA